MNIILGLRAKPHGVSDVFEPVWETAEEKEKQVQKNNLFPKMLEKIRYLPKPKFVQWIASCKDVLKKMFCGSK